MPRPELIYNKVSHEIGTAYARVCDNVLIPQVSFRVPLGMIDLAWRWQSGRVGVISVQDQIKSVYER
jgi:hypothetical protein